MRRKRATHTPEQQSARGARTPGERENVWKADEKLEKMRCGNRGSVTNGDVKNVIVSRDISAMSLCEIGRFLRDLIEAQQQSSAASRRRGGARAK